MAQALDRCMLHDADMLLFLMICIHQPCTSWGMLVHSNVPVVLNISLFGHRKQKTTGRLQE